jgi:cytochrome c
MSRLIVLSWMLLVTTGPGCGLEEGAPSAAGAAQLTGGDPTRGREYLNAYGCDACHTISGIPEAHGRVGPPLSGLYGRLYLAGVLPNTPDNMVLWIRNPPGIDSTTAMPYLGVPEQTARDMAAYLYTRP